MSTGGHLRLRFRHHRLRPEATVEGRVAEGTGREGVSTKDRPKRHWHVPVLRGRQGRLHPCNHGAGAPHGGGGIARDDRAKVYAH